MTRLVHDSSLPQDPSTIRVTITEKDGTKHTVMKSSNDFSMHTYPTREQLLAKYWDQIDSYSLISHAAAHKVIELVDRLEDLEDMRELTELLVP